MTSKTVRRVLAVLVISAFPLSAALHASDKGGPGHDSAKKGGMSGPSMQMHQSMMKGMKEMQGMKPSGNMDHDFATMMRHHHMQGLDMAKYELEHGKDQKMREMAQKITDSQKKETAEFDEWLAQRRAKK